MWIKVTVGIGEEGKPLLLNLAHVDVIEEVDGKTKLLGTAGEPCGHWYANESLDDIAKAIGARDVAELATMRKQASTAFLAMSGLSNPRCAGHATDIQVHQEGYEIECGICSQPARYFNTVISIQE